jgi:DNA polymerase-1
LLLQIHDELIYEVEMDMLDDARALIKRVMENAIESRLPLSANVSSGKNWGELS